MELNDRMPLRYRGITWLMALLGFVVMAISIWGCNAGQRPPESGKVPAAGQEGKDDRILVVTTIFPYYDFVRQIAGDRVKLKLVVPAGMDSHSFEPTPADMIAMQEADVLICNGGEMEQWVEKVLGSLDTSHMKVLTMMDYVDVDEHIWTSPVNARAIVKIISQTLSEAAPREKSRFEDNTQAYLKELKELDSQFRQVVNQGRLHMIVVADKFPFRYFADEYGLSYRAAFSGCSGDTEPSARTIAYLIDKVKEERIPAVYYLELSSHRTAEIIQEETGAMPLLLHSCHNVTRKQFDEGVTYLQLMKQNVENLRYGLE